MAHRILIVDDEVSMLDTLQILLRGEGFEVHAAKTGKAALEQLDEVAPDVVLSDIRMPGTSGIDVLSEIRERRPELPVILMTAQASLQSAIQAVNAGAYYYLQKPFGNAELIAICRRAAEAEALKRENRQLRREIDRQKGVDDERPIGQDPVFSEMLELAETVAPTDSTVLITGESGTGKEIVAGYIHALSERSDGAFVSVNCGALPENLLESELFGHVKGSFTGAHRDREGLLVAARGGTFFLDEVGEMSPALQVKLLRTIQEREVVPVGSTEPVPIDVRIIAATNQDLEQEIRRGGFRTDLYYRLNVIAIHLPPLRERREDIPLLARHFLDAAARQASGADGENPDAEADDAPGPPLEDDALELLQSYDWPGNVRELENALERARVIARGGPITADVLPDRVREPATTPLVSEETPPNPTLEVVERAYILWILESEGGNKARAAEVLGIDPSTLYRKLNRYGVDDEE